MVLELNLKKLLLKSGAFLDLIHTIFRLLAKVPNNIDRKLELRYKNKKINKRKNAILLYLIAYFVNSIKVHT